MMCTVCRREMPEGRTLPYCGKACRRALRGAGPVAPGPSVEAFAALLARMEGVLASRVGAGVSIDAAWDEARWRRELAADLPGWDASAVLSAVRARLASAATAAEVHSAFTAMRGRVDLVRSALAPVG